MNKEQKKFLAGVEIVSVEMISSLVLFTSALAGLIFLIRPRMRKHKKLDLKIFDLIKTHTNTVNTKIMSFITFFGTHTFFIPANLLLILWFLVKGKRNWFSIRIASIALSSLGLMFLLKKLFKRKRPDNPLLEARGLSFPSGHAIMSVTFYGLIIYIIFQTIKKNTIKWPLIIFLLLFIQAIGFSRVYFKVHYPSDVAVGYIAGLLWLLIALEVIKRIENYNNQSPNPHHLSIASL